MRGKDDGGSRADGAGRLVGRGLRLEKFHQWSTLGQVLGARHATRQRDGVPLAAHAGGDRHVRDNLQPPRHLALQPALRHHGCDRHLFRHPTARACVTTRRETGKHRARGAGATHLDAGADEDVGDAGGLNFFRVVGDGNQDGDHPTDVRERQAGGEEFYSWLIPV
eukprot:scaffold8803_cov101-Isochrysis_galbana.AAC.3